MERLKSRKFWIAAVTAVVMLVNVFVDDALDLEQTLGIVIPVAAYLLGQSWVDRRGGG